MPGEPTEVVRSDDRPPAGSGTRAGGEGAQVANVVAGVPAKTSWIDGRGHTTSNPNEGRALFTQLAGKNKSCNWLRLIPDLLVPESRRPSISLTADGHPDARRSQALAYAIGRSAPDPGAD